VSFLSSAVATKRLELLRQLAPKAAAIAMLTDRRFGATDAERERRDVQAAARAFGQELIVVEAGSDRDIETAFTTFVQRGAGALFVGISAFFNARRERLGPYETNPPLKSSRSSRFSSRIRFRSSFRVKRTGNCVPFTPARTTRRSFSQTAAGKLAGGYNRGRRCLGTVPPVANPFCSDCVLPWQGLGFAAQAFSDPAEHYV
jgi:hypothetical protein